MADGKREQDYDNMIAAAQYVWMQFDNKLNPAIDNPIRQARTEALVEQADPKGKEGFMLLGIALGMMIKDREKR